MRSLIAAVLLSSGHAGTEHEDLVSWIRTELGKSEELANKTAGHVCEYYPGDDVEATLNRRQKASHYLQLYESTDIRNNTEWSDGWDPRARRLVEQDECGSLDRSANAKCRQPAKWGHKEGKYDPSAALWYEDFVKFTGVTFDKGSIEDWQKFYFCVLDEERHCGMPPCRCTYPPCDICRAPRAAERERQKHAKPATVKDLGFEQKCKANPGCQDIDGNCCPHDDGKMETCCHFHPTFNDREPVFEIKPPVPEEEVEAALDGGHFLGPLKNTYCKTPKAAVEAKHSIKVTECSRMCSRSERCDLFVFLLRSKSQGTGRCKLYSQEPLKCDARHAKDGSMLYVKNKKGFHPHRLPDITVDAAEASFLAVGDWGSLTCPNRESMHYRTIRPLGSDKWTVDHNAQEEVAKVMTKIARETKPFVVLNVGDNFYWGGIPHPIRGGRGVHDQMWNLGFEMVYSSEELTVPWMGVVGNHDYGGDGCFSDIRAQFDYTIKDMLAYDRWKMPSPYFTQKVFLDGFALEFFMLDTNYEDSNSGRHGGICAQAICPDFIEEGMPEKMIDTKVCIDWFQKLFNDQAVWLKKQLSESTAEWKILGLHHKPMGLIERQVLPLAVEHGVQMMIAGHTHETAVYPEWPQDWGNKKRMLLVVGQGGGSQGVPGCGKADLCGADTDYSFGNLKVNKDWITVSIHRHDEITMGTFYVDREGAITWDKPEGAPQEPIPLKSGGPIPRKRKRPTTPKPTGPRTFNRRTFVPLTIKRNWKTTTSTIPQLKKDGSCECVAEGAVNGINTNRPGCAAHLGRSVGAFCYISGGSECIGSKYSKKIGLHWRKCSSDELLV